LGESDHSFKGYKNEWDGRDANGEQVAAVFIIIFFISRGPLLSRFYYGDTIKQAE
jgi:hypothetical protein